VNHVRRYYASFSYQAGSWDRKVPSRVLISAAGAHTEAAAASTKTRPRWCSGGWCQTLRSRLRGRCGRRGV